MIKGIEALKGVWSAAPTPFTKEMEIDIESLQRMVEHHLRLNVKGLFLCGTNGEGPWLPERLRRVLVQNVVRYTKNRMTVAVQVTDNSAPRILDNIERAEKDGADIAVISSPYFLPNATPENILNLYTTVIKNSSLPVGIYDRGSFGPVFIPDAVLKTICSLKKVLLIKDSSTSPERRELYLEAKRKRPDLCLLNGWEFQCAEYLKAGYDGLLLGGGVFNGYLAGRIIKAVESDNLLLAQRLQNRMNRIMYAVYGGKKIKCWLSGEKKLLVEMGLFRTGKNFLNYPLTKDCVRNIRRVMEKDADILFPEKSTGSTKEIMRRKAKDNVYLHKDFHGALSSGIEYLHRRYGASAVSQYLRQFTLTFYAPLIKDIQRRGLVALKEHLEKTYRGEGGNIKTTFSENELVIEVKKCPAVTHMRKHGYAVAELFSETTRAVNQALCEGTPFVSELLSYDEETGRNIQRFYRRPL